MIKPSSFENKKILEKKKRDIWTQLGWLGVVYAPASITGQRKCLGSLLREHAEGMGRMFPSSPS